jgi:hypothetical protein
MHTWLDTINDAAKQTLYGWPPAACLKVDAAINAFLDARDAHRITPTTEKNDEKNAAKAHGISEMRTFARENIRVNPRMTDAQKNALGVNSADTEPSPVIIPRDGPNSTIKTSQHRPGVVEIHYAGPKPDGVERVEVAHAFLDAPPEDVTLLTEKDTYTKNPWIGNFPHQRGKTLYYSLRYLGTHNQVSEWTPIQSVIVP